MPADHSSTAQFTITLSPAPPVRQGFGTLLLLAPKAANSLNGATTLLYSTATAAAADLAAGYISQGVYDRIAKMMVQTPRPKVRVGNVDLVATEDYGEAFVRIRAAVPDFYGVIPDTRVIADQLTLITAVETDGYRQAFVQNGDSSWLDSGIPVGYGSITAYKRTSFVYHDNTAEFADCAWAASRLAFDPDETSCDWKAELVGVAALTAGLTESQRTLLLANHANVGLPYGALANWLYPGESISGRPVYEILTGDWFRARVGEDTADLFAKLSLAGRKLPITGEGQALMLGILGKRTRQGENAGHFVRGETRIVAEAITQDDRDAKRLRFACEAQIAQSAKLIQFNVYLQNEPLAEG